jgi:hypothetical protein
MRRRREEISLAMAADLTQNWETLWFNHLRLDVKSLIIVKVEKFVTMVH